MTDYFVHKSSYVDDGAMIGPQTRIWHYSHVMGTAMVGAHCSIGQNVFIGNKVVVGDYCKIQNNVSLYEGVILEDYVFCGPSMVFTNVKTPRCEFPRNNSEHYHVTRIKRGASIGANATIVCGITLHECAFIGAGAVVTRDVPAFAEITGVPGRITGWRSACGDALVFNEDGYAVDSTGQKYWKQSDQCVEEVRSER